MVGCEVLEGVVGEAGFGFHRSVRVGENWGGVGGG